MLPKIGRIVDKSNHFTRLFVVVHNSLPGGPILQLQRLSVGIYTYKPATLFHLYMIKADPKKAMLTKQEGVSKLARHAGAAMAKRD